MKTRKSVIFLLALVVAWCCSSCYTPEVNSVDILTCKEGNHAFKPYDLTWNDCTYRYYRWVFDSTAIYDHGDRDQCDWNKLTGSSHHKLTSRKNSMMISWRWDLSGHLWIAPYYHRDGDTFWAKASCTSFVDLAQVDTSLVAIRADIGDIIDTHENIRETENRHSFYIENVTTGEYSFFEMQFDNNFENTREIYPWFGGDKAAPHDITLSRELITHE